MRREPFKYLGISIMILSMIAIFIRIVDTVMYIISSLSEPFAILDAVFNTITFIALFIVPVSIGKLLMEIDVPSRSLIEILIHIDILNLLGRILVMISVINIAYVILKNVQYGKDASQIVNNLTLWIFILVVGIVVNIIADMLKKKL